MSNGWCNEDASTITPIMNVTSHETHTFLKVLLPSFGPFNVVSCQASMINENVPWITKKHNNVTIYYGILIISVFIIYINLIMTKD